MTSPPSAVSTGLFDTPDIAAPLLFGVIFAEMLFGALSVQVYMYYVSFPDDPLYIKLLAYGVYVIECAASIMMLTNAYRWFVAGFGDPALLDRVYLSPIDQALLSGVITFVVQIFYCRRIVTIKQKAWPAAALISVLSILQLVLSFYAGIGAYRNGRGTFSTRKKVPMNHAAGTIVRYSSAAGADVAIAISLIYLLFRSRKTALSNSRFIIKRLLHLIMETNLLTSGFAISVMILMLVADPPYFLYSSLLLGRLHSNSLLLILNNRQQIRRDNQQQSAHISLGQFTSPETLSSEHPSVGKAYEV